MTAAAVAARPAVAGWVHRFVSVHNPYTVCRRCRRQVTARHDAVRCGCGPADPDGANLPCGHPAGVESVCPTYGPLGCQCPARYKRVDHPPVAWLKARGSAS